MATQTSVLKINVDSWIVAVAVAVGSPLGSLVHRSNTKTNPSLYTHTAEITRLRAENALLKSQNSQWMRLKAENCSLKLQLQSFESLHLKVGTLLKHTISGGWSPRTLVLHTSGRLSWYYSDPESEAPVRLTRRSSPRWS